MKNAITLLAPLALLAGFASCNSVRTLDDDTSSPRDLQWSVGALHTNTELDAVEFDDPGFAVLDLEDERRRRTGVGASIGTESIAGTLEVFHEDFLGADGVGVSIGVAGRPEVHVLDNGATLFVPYRFGGTLVNGDDAVVAGATGDFSYVEACFEAGIGLDIDGLRPAVGITSKSFVGNIDFEGEADHEYDDEDFQADLLSGYLELGYRPEACGAEFVLRALLGDELGGSATVSWTF